LEIPEGYEAQVRPRSGLAFKHGLTVLNSPGTIDSDYRGEVKVLLVNLGNVDVTINYGTRIAQLVFAKVERVQLDYTYSGVQAVNPLSETQRGEGGFGSTGTDGAAASAAGGDTTTTDPSTLRHCC
jgi:dUTP pyrophosphatase